MKDQRLLLLVGAAAHFGNICHNGTRAGSHGNGSEGSQRAPQVGYGPLRLLARHALIGTNREARCRKR